MSTTPPAAVPADYGKHRDFRCGLDEKALGYVSWSQAFPTKIMVGVKFGGSLSPNLGASCPQTDAYERLNSDTKPRTFYLKNARILVLRLEIEGQLEA